MGVIQNISIQREKDSMVRKYFATSPLCFPAPSFMLAEPSLEAVWKPRNKDGIAMALLTLFSVEGKGEAVIASDTPNATLFFMSLFEQANPCNSTDTTVSVPSAIW